MARSIRPSADPAVILRAAGWDAGNRSMRRAGRATWNGQDYDAAVAEMTRLCEAWAAERERTTAARIASEHERLEATA